MKLLMNARIVLFGVLLHWAVICHADPVPAVLILHDQQKGTTTEKMGMAYSIMLENLLGHFNSNVTMMPVRDYVAEKMNAYDVIFYLGSVFDEPLSEAFLSDVMKTKKTVVWFKYNLWQLTRNGKYQFTPKYGFSFRGIRGLNAKADLSNPNPGFFNRVQYKGFNLDKYYLFDEKTGVNTADPDAGMISVADAGKVKVIASVLNEKTGEKMPYLVNSGNFWYFADIPLSFIGPRDRYLVLADVLHDLVKVNHAERHIAMVRLEDISAMSSLTGLDLVTRYLQQEHIPFSVAVIPHYKDPLGVRSKGVALDIPFSQAKKLQGALKQAIERGGDIVMHGFTHQYSKARNPYSGVSGEDYEFWDSTKNAPVAEDSVAWALGRLQAGLEEFRAEGITPVAWGTPHYQDSPNTIKATRQVFRSVYQRSFYYTADAPNLSMAPGRDIAVDQFFPYEIVKDHYGRHILPENLGNVRYVGGTGDGAFNIYGETRYSWQDIDANARHATIVRDGFASFFFHPYLADPDSGQPGMQDFQALVSGITRLGYTWANPRSLKARHSPARQSSKGN